MSNGLRSFYEAGEDAFVKIVHRLLTIAHVKDNISSDIFPSILERFKNALKCLVWECQFQDVRRSVFPGLPQGNIVRMKVAERSQFSLGCQFSFEVQGHEKTVDSTFDEAALIQALYCHEDFYKSVGKDFCLLFDVAYALGGPETIVESGYSVMGSQQQRGGMDNSTLATRTKLDWNLPPSVLDMPNLLSTAAAEYSKTHRAPTFSTGVHSTKGPLVLNRISKEKGRIPIFN